MNNIPLQLRQDLEADAFYGSCARQDALHDHECQGDPVRGRAGRMIEWEHALIYAGRQVQKRYAIVPLCWYVHRGPGQDKEINIWIALNRGSQEELLELSAKGGRDYFRYRGFLNARYGVYKSVENGGNNEGINYGYPGDNQEVFHSRY